MPDNVSPMGLTILLSSAGRRVALLRAFREDAKALDVGLRVIATDMSRLTAAGMVADELVQVPPVEDDGFISSMLSVCQDRQVDLVVPTIDPELPVFAKERSSFQEIGTSVLISDSATINIASDKAETHAWLTARAFPTVQQCRAGDRSPRNQEWPLPLVAKPVGGSASEGVMFLQSYEEAEGLPEDYIVQTRAAGEEFTVDVWVDANGRTRCAVPRRRIKVRAGEVAKGVTCNRKDIASLASSLAEALPGTRGPITVQLFADGNELRIIEINPRFGGGYPLAWEAGARFPRAAIRELLGRESRNEDFAWTDGVVMLRYDDAVFIDSDAARLKHA